MASVVELTVDEVVAPYPAMVLADQPLLYWRLGETSGTQAVDFTGNGRTGTYTGHTFNQAGAISDANPAVQLDATTGRVKVDAGFQLAYGTIELWLYVTALPGANATVSTFNDGDSTSTVDKTIYLQPDGKLRFYVFDGTQKTTSVPASATVPLSTWTHIVATFDGTTSRLYQNGVEIGAVASATTYDDFPDSRFSVGYIGNSGGAVLARLSGVRDEAALYDVVLSSARILQHFQTASGAFEKAGALVADTLASGNQEVALGRQAAVVAGVMALGHSADESARTGVFQAGTLPKATRAFTPARVGVLVADTVARATDLFTASKIGAAIAGVLARGFRGSLPQPPDLALPLTVGFQTSITSVAFISTPTTSMTLVAPRTEVQLVPANQTLLVQA